MHTLTKTSLLSVMIIPNSVAVTYRDAVPFKEALFFLHTSFSLLQRNIFSNPVLKLAPSLSLGLSLRLPSTRIGISIFKETFHSSHCPVMPHCAALLFHLLLTALYHFTAVFSLHCPLYICSKTSGR